MRRFAVPAALAAILALFLALCRGAYRGFFDAVDLERLAGAQRVPQKFLYVLLGYSFDFPRYVAGIHALHILAVIALYFLLRRLRSDPPGALAGTALFALNMAALEIFWEPSRSPEIAAALFSILALFAWTYDRWIFSFVLFLIACRFSSPSLFLAFVLALYEREPGRRRWKRLAPFFAAVVILGLPLAEKHDDIIRITPTALRTTFAFYWGRLLGLIAVPAAGLWIFGRRGGARWGIATFAVLFAPALALPFDLNGAQLYLPAIGLAIAAASVLRHPAVAAAFVALWIPWNYFAVRSLRVPLIATQNETRLYERAILKSIQEDGLAGVYVYDTAPPSIERPGAAFLLKILAPRAELCDIEAPCSETAVHRTSVTIVRWHPEWKDVRITSRRPDTKDLAYIQMDTHTPVWQLGEGWYFYEGTTRWMAPRSLARLMRPAGPGTFQLDVLVGADLIKRNRQVHVEVRAAGAPIGEKTITKDGLALVSWPVAAAPPGPVEIEIAATPPFLPNPDGSHPLGLAVRGFGFK